MSRTSQGLDVSKMATEGFGQMMNSMDFFKRAWSSLATPFTPTLNVEELDKRITDLKAVEQWLSLNQNLLRSTIQGLEIQRGTLDAINTVTNTFGNAMKPSDDSLAQSLARQAAAAAQKAVEPPAPEAAESKSGGLFRPFDWSPFGMPSSMLPGFHTAQSSRVGAAAEDAPDTNPGAGAAAGEGADADGAEETAARKAARDAADNAADEAGLETGAEADAGASGGAQGAADDATSSAKRTASGGGATPQEAGAGTLAPGLNPVAWWEMLQENFRQIAQAAAGDLSKASAAAVSAATAGTSAVLKAGSAGGTGAGKAADKATPRGKGTEGGSVTAGRGSRSGGSTGSATAPRSRKATGSKGGSGADAAGTGVKRTRSKSRSSKDPG